MFRSSLVAGGLIALTLAPAAAQQPTQAQRDAVRASCRSDFMANCAGVQPGGKEALECLMRNEPQLSASCRSAVNAIATPASSPATSATAARPRPSDAAPPAQGQSSMPAAAALPSTKSPATAPPRKTTAGSRATTTPAAASAAASGSASGPTATPAVAPTVAPMVAPLGPIRPMLPRRALLILAQCRPEQQRLCAGVPAGGGKILSCLAANAQQLSPTCYQALARVSD
jgi:hypothetical protein